MEGYDLSELEDRVALAAVMFKYRPIITWEMYPVLNVDESRMMTKKQLRPCRVISGFGYIGAIFSRIAFQK
jgi:hypothetical protein